MDSIFIHPTNACIVIMSNLVTFSDTWETWTGKCNRTSVETFPNYV